MALLFSSLVISIAVFFIHRQQTLQWFLRAVAEPIVQLSLLEVVQL